jgi:hypothetical protein
MVAVIVKGKRERWKGTPRPVFAGARDYVIYGRPQRRYRPGSAEQWLYMRGYLHGLSFDIGDYPELRLPDGIPYPWFEEQATREREIGT